MFLVGESCTKIKEKEEETTKEHEKESIISCYFVFFRGFRLLYLIFV